MGDQSRPSHGTKRRSNDDEEALAVLGFGGVIINVCPAAVTSASPDRIWNLLTTPERFADWNDATYVGSEPPGPVTKDQTIHLTARSLGRRWPLDMKVRNIDPQHRWIELHVLLPFGIENRERLA